MTSYLPAVPVLVFGVISFTGLVTFALDDTATATADAVAATIASTVGRGELLQGSITARFDAEVERSHPLRDGALPVVAVARYLLLRQGNAGVVVGRDDWLFTDEEFQHHPRDDQRLQDRIQYIQSVAALLERRHAASLVVVIVPSKARVAAAYVPSYLESAVVHRRLPRVVAALREANISVVDAEEVLSAENFFRRDTHWRPSGAHRVAASVRDTLGESDEFGGFNGFGDSYRLQQGSRETLRGDLLSYVPAGEWGSALGLTAEEYHPLDAERVGTVSGGGGLFDTPEIPVALVGTSYSADARFGFASALRAVLGGDVLNLAEAAGGPFQPMEEFLQGETIREIPPQLVIWEVPERYLTLPDIGGTDDPESVALDGGPW